MRRFHALSFIAVLGACSGSAPVVTPPPPPPPPGVTPRTLFDALSVGTGGGTFRYTKAGDPLDGLTLTVPTAAFGTATQWTIVADSTVVVSLPANFSQVGPALVISNGQGYASSPITLTMPMVVGAGNSVAPFYFDPATRQFEGIPMVAQTASSATLAARHFTGDFTATRGPTQTPLRSARMGFGDVVIVWVKIADSWLTGIYSTDFKPGRDDWEFANYGDYIGPAGDCEGMSVSALYYQYFVKQKGAGTGLYHQYDGSLSNQWDNVQGIRFAGSVQGDYSDRWDAGVRQTTDLDDQGIANGTNVQALTSKWLLITFKLTGNPILMALRGAPGGHAVVAYAATSTGAHTEISFADPNFPATVRTMTFESGVLTPVTLQLNASETARIFDKAWPLGVTADVPLNEIDTRYTEFKAKTAGKDRYPTGYSWIYHNEVTDSWDPMGGVVQTSVGTFLPGILCPACRAKYPGVVPDGRMGAIVYDALGKTSLSTTGVGAPLTPGSQTFVIAGYAKSPYSTTGTAGFIDSKTVTVIYTPAAYTLSVLTAPLSVAAGATSLTDSISITRTSFTGPITLSATADSGSGITINFISQPGLGNAATFVVTAPPGLAPNTYNVTITGASTLPNVTTSFAVVVGIRSLYSFSVQPDPLFVVAGRSQPYAVTINRNTFAGAVSVSAAADDAGITVTPNPAPGTTGTQVALNVSVGAGVSAGVHMLTLIGASTGFSDLMSQFAVVVNLAAAGPPTGIVITPIAPSVNVNSNVQFTAYLVDAQGNRAVPESGWGISILSDSSAVATDLATSYDAAQRWQTHTVLANGVGTSQVRAAYYRLSDGQSTFVAIARITVTP